VRRSTTGTALRRHGLPGLALLAASAVGAAALLSGCSSGQVSQTASVVAPVAGISVDTGPLAIRDAVVAYGGPEGYPAGGTAPLVIRIFNNVPTGQALRLTGARLTGDITGRVVLLGGQPATGAGTPAAVPSGGPAVASAPPGSSASGSARPSASASATRSPAGGSAPASPSPTRSASATASGPAGNPAISVAIPAGGYALLVPGTGAYLAITGLSAPLRPGMTVSLELTFDRADGGPLAVSLRNVPIAPPLSPGPRVPNQFASPGGTE
jgi:hypothetical protein